MKELDEEFFQNLEELIKAGDKEAIRASFDDMHAADIALVIKELDLDEAEFIIASLDSDLAADVLMELDEDDRHRLLEDIPNKDIAKQFVEHLDTDDAVDLLQELDKEDQEEVLPPRKSGSCHFFDT